MQFLFRSLILLLPVVRCKVPHGVLSVVFLSPILLLLSPCYARHESDGEFDGQPDVFFLGVPKAGSSSLHKAWIQHSHLCSGKEKELYMFGDGHYYPYKNENVLHYYLGNWEACRQGSLTADFTPWNMDTPNILLNIKRFYSPASLAKKRFIIILREPVDRLISYRNYELRNECPSKNACLGCSISSFHKYFFGTVAPMNYCAEYYIDNGVYLSKIKLLLEFIPRKHVLILNMHTLIANYTSVTHSIATFLNVGTDNVLTALPHDDHGVHGAKFPGKVSSILCSDYHHLLHHYKTLNEGLLEFINDGSLGRPVMEPDFPPFIDKWASRCITDPAMMEKHGA